MTSWRSLLRSRARALRRDRRGNAYVEYVSLVAICALGLVGASRYWEGTLTSVVAQRVQQLSANVSDSVPHAPPPPNVPPSSGGRGNAQPPGSPACTGDTCPNGRCFAAGTLVYTADGDRPIEDVAVGDWVWSRSEDTGELALRRVLHTYVTDSVPVIALEIDGARYSETLTVTPDHPFWVERLGWTRADELESATLLWSPDGSLTGHAGAAWGARAKVYNFEVDEDHTYFVGAQHAWVHNACAPTYDPARGDKLNKRTGLTSAQDKYYRTEIDDAPSQDQADRIRYQRYLTAQDNLGKKGDALSYDEWLKSAQRIRENADRGNAEERAALGALGVPNNNGPNPVTYPSADGKTRPDGVTDHAVIDVKSFPDGLNKDGSQHVVYLSDQLHAQSEGAHADGKVHVTIITNGDRDTVRPSGPLAQAGSDAVLHRDSNTGAWSQWDPRFHTWESITDAEAKTIVNGS